MNPYPKTDLLKKVKTGMSQDMGTLRRVIIVTIVCSNLEGLLWHPGVGLSENSKTGLVQSNM